MKQNLESEISGVEPLDANEPFPIHYWAIDSHPQSYAGDILKAMREPLLVLDGTLRVKVAIRAFYETFKVTPEQTLGRSLYELGNGQWSIPMLRKLLDELIRTGGEFDDYQVEHDFPDIGRRTMLLNARRLHHGDKNTKLILLAIEDITERRAAEHKVEISEVRFRRLFEAAHDGILMIDVKTHMITDVNPFLVELLDYPRDYFIGKEL
jgi:PAS domain-containing protein